MPAPPKKPTSVEAGGLQESGNHEIDSAGGAGPVELAGLGARHRGRRRRAI
jgi:hypothetical protein